MNITPSLALLALAKLPVHTTNLPTTLLAGALDHLLRYTLNGCGQSARHAAYLLDHLSNQDGMSEELCDLCQRMSETLEGNPVPNPWKHLAGNAVGEFPASASQSSFVP